MSRHTAKGIHPITKREVEVAYGWDLVPGGTAGYFFQVFSPHREDMLPETNEMDFNSDNLIVNEGFIHGIRLDKLREWLKKFKVEMVSLVYL